MQYQTVTCPHCGLLCDDLKVNVTDLTIEFTGNKDDLCNLAANAFKDASLDKNELPKPLVSGQPVTVQQALERATELLRNAKLPLISGLIGDVHTCREAIALTEKIGGVIDHANGYTLRKSVSAVQRYGDVRTTLAEARNRADCVVIFGKNICTKFPRLLTRILSPKETFDNEGSKNKKIFIIDISDDGTTRCEVEDNITHVQLNYPRIESLIYRFQEVVTKPKEYFTSTDAQTKELFKILEIVLTSKYTTFIWNASDFNPESAEHTVQALNEIIKILIESVRCVSLSLSGSNGEVTANNVTTWKTGTALPVSFTQGIPIHDPVLYDGMKMIENSETDCLLWVATYNSENIPPKSNVPTILLGHPKMKCKQADVYLPVGIPGIDHQGLACRTDGVATLPLRRIREINLPPASELLNKLIQNI